jgi:small-conductance mechanosensitive channel
MNELVALLRHPAIEAAELKPLMRVYVATFVFAVTVAIAFSAGALTARWARRHGGSITERGQRQTVRVRRGLVALCLFVGIYLAVAIAPLPLRVAQLLSGITYVFGALVGARLLIHAISLFLTTSATHASAAERIRLEREYVPLAEKVTTFAVALVFAVIVAKHFGRDFSSLLAALGVGSLAIGLAAQQTLGNMIAGFVLLIDRPFRPGDRIKLASGEIGEVREIGVRSTTIQLLDGNRLVVPNTELANSRVVNFAALVSHVDVKVTVAHGQDTDQIARLLTAALAAESSVRATLVRLTNLTEHGIEFTVGFDCATPPEALAAEDRIRRRIVSSLVAANIAMPRPIRG